ncbi:Phosphoglycolate phosphatase [Parelusimicrobium proximum]|uniref:HAD family hydrolase n=1 Tax=Parelusimicrobium proximum TaxID=3228953 RepID=UPI003D1686CB
MSKLVLFDLDGTLVHTGMCGKLGLDKAIENLYGVKPEYPLEILIGNTDHANFELVFKHVFKRNIKPAELKKLKAEYLKVLPAEVAKEVKSKKYTLIKGIEKFLKALEKQKDVYIALGTGNWEEAAFIKLGPSKLVKYFKTGGFACDSADRAKMLAAGVKKAEKYFKTKFEPSDVFVIGDTHKDIVAAKANGYHSAVVLDGYGDKKIILRAAAELEMPDFTDIDMWFVWMDINEDPKGVKRGRYLFPSSAIEHVFFSRTGIDEDRLKMFRVKKYSDLPSGKLF